MRHADPTRAAPVVREMMGGHKPQVWLSDRYTAQQGHGLAQQTCLAHSALTVVMPPAASILAGKRRALEQLLAAILAAPTPYDLARDLQGKLRRARDQRLTFADRSGGVEAANNGCERDLRPCVVQRKFTNGCRAMWAARGEADTRTVVDAARLTPGTGAFATSPHTVSA